MPRKFIKKQQSIKINCYKEKMIVDKGEMYRHYDSGSREDVRIDIINEDDEEAESSN